MVATTTCAYNNPVTADGSAPGSVVDVWNFASSTCVTLSDDVVSTSTIQFPYGSSSENPLVVQDSGSVVFGLALILFVCALATLGLVFSRK